MVVMFGHQILSMSNKGSGTHLLADYMSNQSYKRRCPQKSSLNLAPFIFHTDTHHSYQVQRQRERLSLATETLVFYDDTHRSRKNVGYSLQKFTLCVVALIPKKTQIKCNKELLDPDTARSLAGEKKLRFCLLLNRRATTKPA
ncbi:MAG: hypothetical protein Q9164_004410 [Protoblastenia rupestris]